MQLVVLGMHRSGTSGLTRLLNMAGAYFGPEGIATDANEENPKGFWERRDVRAVCDRLLHSGGFDWWRVSEFSVDRIPADVREEQLAELRRILLEMDAHRPWVMKEPRLCLLFGLLRPLFEVPVCVHVSRGPLDVAASISARNGFPLHVGLALWEVYTLRSLAASTGLPRLQVRYEDLMADARGTVGPLVEKLRELGVDGLRVPRDQEIEGFLSTDLWHQRDHSRRRGGFLNEQQVALAEAIDSGEALRSWGATEPSEGAVDALRAFESACDAAALVNDLLEERGELDARIEEVGKLEEQLRRGEVGFAELNSEVARLNEQLAAAVEVNGRERERADEAVARVADLDAQRRAAVENAALALRQAATRVRGADRSRAWQLADKAIRLRQAITPGLAKMDYGPLTHALQGIDEAHRVLIASVTESDEGDVPAAPGASDDLDLEIWHTRLAQRRSSRPKVAVLAWDVGHNPLGRAYIMAELLARRFDVEVWGARFDRYGGQIWAPLRDAEIPIHSFAGKPFPRHLQVMEEVARRIDADALWVSKPRLPSFALGILAKQVRNRPLVLDVDDHELAFFSESTGIDPEALQWRRDDPDLVFPFERDWTRACDSRIGAADALTVSNVALQERYGGVIVPHARDERVFDPELYDRAEVRRRLGVRDSDRLLLFGGTPRAHKGVVAVLEALDALGDDRYRLALFGTTEFEAMRPQIGDLGRWVIPLPYQRFDELAPIVGAADLSCVLQDPDHVVARYQMPAKVSDALAMEVPCIVSNVPPLRPLVEADVVNVYDGERPLHEHIAEVFDDREAALDRAERGRKVFLEELSYAAACDVVAPVFEGLIDDPPEVSPALSALVDVPRRLFVNRPEGLEQSVAPARVPGRHRRAIAPGQQFDLVIFWKQNDTSIYGRRQDMFLKYLERSGRFANIVHFDNPVTPESLVGTYRSSRNRTDQGRLVVRQTVSRLLRRRDHDNVHFHTFLHAGSRSRYLGLPERAAYVDYVASVLDRHDVGSRPTVFWVYPTNFDFPAIADALDPDLVVADVVDDNRTWYEPGSDRYEEIDRNYQDVLARSDVVLANCEPVADSMMRFAPEVHVVPNGCELPRGGARPPRPRELRELSGPIIGYVGNLSSRIDIGLLEALSRARPRWQFVFVGSAHLDQSILRLDRRPNVHFVGVKPYEETLDFVQHFDVALIPHVDNEMTRSMNPLKAFVYCSAGVPVVSTPIANIGELAQLITIAEGPTEFVEAIEAALQTGRQEPDMELLKRHAWEQRVDDVIAFLDAAVADPE